MTKKNREKDALLKQCFTSTWNIILWIIEFSELFLSYYNIIIYRQVQQFLNQSKILLKKKSAMNFFTFI